MYYTQSKKPSAWIVSPNDKGRKKVYLNRVYLDNNQEFLIELFNPLQDSVLAEIKINGKKASNNGLVLRPGERFYLDCFIDDRKKFVFKTYEVENTTESMNAIANNGYVEIYFYKELTYNGYLSNGIYSTTIYNPYSTIDTNIYFSTDTGGYSINMDSLNKSISAVNYTSNNITSNNIDSLNKSISGNNLNTKSIDKTETGRIEKGTASNQKFESVNMVFETYCINNISYQLLPNSKKPIKTSELKKNFCSNCGNKLKGSERFCPSCGNKI